MTYDSLYRRHLRLNDKLPIFRYAKLREYSYLRRQDRYDLIKYIARVLILYRRQVLIKYQAPKRTLSR